MGGRAVSSATCRKRLPPPSFERRPAAPRSRRANRRRDRSSSTAARSSPNGAGDTATPSPTAERNRARHRPVLSRRRTVRRANPPPRARRVGRRVRPDTLIRVRGIRWKPSRDEDAVRQSTIQRDRTDRCRSASPAPHVGPLSDAFSDRPRGDDVEDRVSRSWRSEESSERRSFVSPTSAVYQFFAS